MKKLPRIEYSPEFKEQAIRIYQESGLSVAEVAKQLAMLKSSLYQWMVSVRKSEWSGAYGNQHHGQGFGYVALHRLATRRRRSR